MIDPTAPLITVNITPGEILQPGFVIEVRADRAVDPRFAQGAVRVFRGRRPVRLLVEVASRGRTLRLATAELAPGPYSLEIGELLDTKGQRLVERMVVPFAIVPIAGRVDPGLQIEHVVRLALGDTEIRRVPMGEEAPGGYIDVVKASVRSDGAPAELAFDQDGRKIDTDEAIAAVIRRRFEKFGRVDETLWGRLEQAKDDDRIPVVVWPRLNLPPAPYEKPATSRLTEPPEGERNVDDLSRRARAELSQVLKRAGLEVDPVDDDEANIAPFLRATATAGQVRELARNEVVGAVLFDDQTEILDLGTSVAVARSDQAHSAGFDGTGIRAAVWETGPSVTTNLTFAGRFTTTPGASAHARLTSAVIRNTEPSRSHGHAPDCDLYSANTSGNDALRWAARDQGCTVISQSFHRSTEPGGAGLQADDLLKDWLALRWPYPTIVQAAGNFWATDPDMISPPQDEYVNHKGYNTLAVGNHDDTAGAMSSDSVFRNPTSTHGDRELPEIAANGTTVSAVGESMSGTSFAAPAAAGVTAILQDVDGVLCSWPEGCRAILLASAGRNVDDGTWWEDVSAGVDGSDGAGAVDAQAGVWIAQQRRWRDAPATRRGWDVGTLSSSLIGPDRLATFRYRVAVPGLLWFSTVKVALAWDSAVTSSGDNATASTLTVDLDLLVRDSRGVTVARAASYDNSYEVVEFQAMRGETYEIIIRRWSGTDSVWYGIAWTVTGISLLEPIGAVFARELLWRSAG